MDNEIVDIVKATPNILGEIYKDLAQPSVRAIGKALGTVFEFSTAILLPLKLKNEKLKMTFKKNLDDYKEKLEKIPEEKRCEVHPQLGTPIVEKLTYTTNEEIAGMFTTLLANASSVDMVNTAHPSFVSIIERISPDEARIMRCFQYKRDWEYCSYNANLNDAEGFVKLKEHLTLLDDNAKITFPQNMNAYIYNLISLGLLVDMSGEYKIYRENYDAINKKNGLDDLRNELVPQKFKSIDVEESFIRLTPFGRLFLNACIE